MTECIRELMPVNPRSLECRSTVTEAARQMHDEDAGFVPVVKATTIVGTLSDRDTAIRVAVAAERSPDAATIDPRQEHGGTTREVVEGIST
jgi:predicted transcriptional regulator